MADYARAHSKHCLGKPPSIFVVATAAYSSYVTENDYYGSSNVGGVLRWKQNVCESRGCSLIEYDEYSSSRVDAKALFIIVLVAAGDT